MLLPKRVSLGARRVVSVAAALDVSLLVDEGGSVLSWGARHAPLGYEVGAAQCTPRQVRFGAARDAVVVAVAVVAANEHCLAVAHDGRLFAWGSNARGQLAMPPSACPVSVTPCAVYLNLTSGASGVVHVASAAAGRIRERSETQQLCVSPATQDPQGGQPPFNRNARVNNFV